MMRLLILGFLTGFAAHKLHNALFLLRTRVVNVQIGVVLLLYDSRGICQCFKSVCVFDGAWKDYY